MKLFTAIAAAAAVITCCIGSEIPANASTSVDLMRGTLTRINDGNPYAYIIQGTRTYKTHTPDQRIAYPLEGAAPGTKRTEQLSRADDQVFANFFYEADSAGDTYRNAVN